MSTQVPAAIEPGPPLSPSIPIAWIALVLTLAPALSAVWLVPGFVTQDGPAHLYNAQILNDALSGGRDFGRIFSVRWSPLPNWSGHALLMGLLALVTPRTADRLATTIPAIALAASAFWLRLRVAGPRGAIPSALLCAMLGLNVSWLFGFTSFLLGASLTAITWGVWWGGREDFGLGRALVLAALIVLGYFAHLVSLGLTVGGLIVLASITPGRGFRARVGWTAAALLPLTVLGPLYRGLMSEGGPMRPIWGHWTDFRSLASWRSQLGWVDPISLGKKNFLPGLASSSSWYALMSPAVLMIAALLIATPSSWRRLDRGRRAWTILSAAFLVGGLITPDTLGPGHGNYLPQRVVLLGLMALVPWIAIDLDRWSGRFASALLASALILQTFWVWDYARESDREVRPFLDAARSAGFHQRIGTLLIESRGRFRANPLLHADNLVGMGTGHVLWANYETAHYYFPVQVRGDAGGPPAESFETIARMDSADDRNSRVMAWLRLLQAHHRQMDLLFVKGADPRLDAITGRWFDRTPLFAEGDLRVLIHR